TNYILTRMDSSGIGFETALKEAQQCGYAEANPVADILGLDAARKLAILSSIAFRSSVNYEDIPVQGINNISADDINLARYLGCSVKLLALGRKTDHGIMARVAPVLLKNTDPLARVSDVYNAIIVKGDAVGDVLFFGRGAGKLPTASAVISDIFDIVRHNMSSQSIEDYKLEETAPVNLDTDGCKSDFLIRVKAKDRFEAMNEIAGLFKRFEFIFPEKAKLGRPIDQDQVIFVAYDIYETDIDKKIELLETAGCIDNVLSILRVEGEA
ncbi:MAG TPA: homoserine dehydrogenase, partial [Bacillota bacterium]|nr:homoserine dehydrogenase [Bacillota bacterium]